MSRESIENDFRIKLQDVGRVALNAIYKNDIEAYFLGIELVDSDGNTVDYFAWPVLPDELSESQPEMTRIGTTIGGVYVTDRSAFTPRTISLRGTFGRRFKVLLNNSQLEIAGFTASIQNGKFSITSPNLLGQQIPQLSSFIKTGYGCIKIVEAIKEKSKKLDAKNKPHSLYFYNPILGNNYVVKVNSFTHSQNSNQNNMLPAYSLQLTAIAPLDSVLSRSRNIASAIKNLGFSGLQKRATSIVQSLSPIGSLNSKF